MAPGATNTLGTFTVNLPGQPIPLTVGYAWTGPTQPGTDVPGYFSVVVKNLPVSAFEMSVIDARLNGRRGPADAVLQVTDQYRQDEP